MTSMILKDIYDKDITRHINPAVVVNDHALETINAEIEEYVFTDELREKLFDFLHTLLNKKSGKTGIWINGYYGSGKSHFIKYIHYCLNPDTREKAFEHYLKAVRKSESGLSEVTESNILLMKKKIEQEGVENILFNVEDVTGDGKANTRLTRIFLNMLNRHRGYNSTNIILALHFEKYLDRKGIFELFKQKLFDEEGFTWKDDCNRLASSSLRMIVDLAGSIDPSLDTESMYNTLNNQEKIEITIEATLIPEIIDYLQILPGNARLVFLVDEISQYI
ncbi:MAG: hypothetical protein IH594_14315, partial [Bacteroidales bacterium]|nr:hypothetical protein [Bacteroidales bacterium]